MVIKNTRKNLLMKNIVVLLLLVSVSLAGCLDYKSFDQEGAAAEPSAELIDEIAAIERELGIGEGAEGTGAAGEIPTGTEETAEEELVGEEVILPELGEEVEEVTEDAALETITVKENELVKLKVNVNDPDKDAVRYQFSPPLNKEGEWKTSYGDAGEYVVTISATDGKLTTEKKLKLVVEKVNVPPVIESLRDLAVKEGDNVEVTVKATDPNKDAVSVTISPPLSDGSWETDHTSAGEYVIKVVASDGELKSEASFVLTVHDVNVLPEITNLPERITVKEGEEVRINPTATDLDGDSVTIRISDPVGDDSVWQTGFTDNGQYVVTVTVTDGKDTITRKVNLVVEDVNMPPEITDVTLG